jgi:hypothetical protein
LRGDIVAAQHVATVRAYSTPATPTPQQHTPSDIRGPVCDRQFRDITDVSGTRYLFGRDYAHGHRSGKPRRPPRTSASDPIRICPPWNRLVS